MQQNNLFPKRYEVTGPNADPLESQTCVFDTLTGNYIEFDTEKEAEIEAAILNADTAKARCAAKEQRKGRASFQS